MFKKKRSLLIIFIVISIYINFALESNTKTDIENLKLDNDGHEIEYITKFNKMKTEYSKNPFFNSFLKEISILSYDYINKSNNRNHKIHILVNLDNNYIYPLIVSITSAVYNANKNETTLIYHLLCSKNLRKKDLNMLKSLLLIYPANLEVIFYNMGNSFIKYKYQKYSQVTYYRLISPIFIPLDRIIYLDCDVLIFKDLYELYQESFGNTLKFNNFIIISII